MSGAVPDNRSGNHSRTAGYGSYPAVSGTVPDEGSVSLSWTAVFGSYLMIRDVTIPITNHIARIGMRVVLLLLLVLALNMENFFFAIGTVSIPIQIAIPIRIIMAPNTNSINTSTQYRIGIVTSVETGHINIVERLESMNCIFTISVQVHILLCPDTHYNDSL